MIIFFLESIKTSITFFIIIVITVEPALINTDELFELDIEYIYFKITNHGLINAEQGQLQLPNVPSMKFTPSIDPVGVIPGKDIIQLKRE
jgi:hypothetical protein